MKRFSFRVGIFAAAALTGFCPSLRAGSGTEDLLGAKALLESIESSGSAGTGNSKATPRAVLAADLKRFEAERNHLDPKSAAQQWLVFFDRFLALPAPERNPYSYHSYSDDIPTDPEQIALANLVAVIPGPEAWSELSQQIQQRPVGDNKNPLKAGEELSLRLFAAVLTGDGPLAEKELDRLLKILKPKASASNAEWRTSMALNLAKAIKQMPAIGDRMTAAEKFRVSLELREPSHDGRVETFPIPDLVYLTGSTQAQDLIKQALLSPGVSMEVKSGPETLKLAQRIALENLKHLSLPQWGLISSPSNAVELFEAFDKQFPVNAKKNSQGIYVSGMPMPLEDAAQARAKAGGNYVAALVKKGRKAEATKFLSKLSESELPVAFEAIKTEVDPEQAWKMLGAILNNHPKVDLWDDYVKLAQQAGKGGELIGLMEEAAAKSGTSDGPPPQAKGLIAAYLADDQVEKALPYLRQLIQAKPPQTDALHRWSVPDFNGLQDALKLARLGNVLQSPALTREGLDAALNLDSSEMAYMDQELCEALMKDGRYKDAEAHLQASLQRSIKREQNQPFGESQSAGNLKMLVRLYVAAGRYEDALALTQSAPWWGVEDLVKLTNPYGGQDAFQVAVAKALAKVGRKEEAEQVLKAYLFRASGDDNAYALLVELVGDSLIPWLDALYGRDQFQERPLIWKAVLLFKAGKIAEAEETARKAIKVDPTDGEEPKGDRVRAYAVLADILEAKGDKENAAFFKRIVESVRVAEVGDEMMEAGLLKRSLAQYEKAQTAFADAYCVQWRLAERLNALGKFKEAEEHYRIAFERMPEQFGQVASLCFGCEGVFETAPRRSAAERVLTRMESEGSKRPQVYYLLGQLRQAQDRDQEARAYYEKAVQMDPGYLDAWGRLAGMSQEVYMSQKDRDGIILTALKLDPLQRHIQCNPMDAYDLKGLWEVLAENQKFVSPRYESLLPFPAAKAALDKRKQTMSQQEQLQMVIRTNRTQNEPQKPESAILSQTAIRWILQAMEMPPLQD